MLSGNQRCPGKPYLFSPSCTARSVLARRQARLGSRLRGRCRGKERALQWSAWTLAWQLKCTCAHLAPPQCLLCVQTTMLLFIAVLMLLQLPNTAAVCTIPKTAYTTSNGYSVSNAGNPGGCCQNASACQANCGSASPSFSNANGVLSCTSSSGSCSGCVAPFSVYALGEGYIGNNAFFGSAVLTSPSSPGQVYYASVLYSSFSGAGLNNQQVDLISQWWFWMSDGSFYNAGSGLCLDVSGSNVVAALCTGASSQKWKGGINYGASMPCYAGDTNPTDCTQKHISNYASGLCLNNANAGTAATVSTCNTMNNAVVTSMSDVQYIFSPPGGNYYTPTPYVSNFSPTVSWNVGGNGWAVTSSPPPPAPPPPSPPQSSSPPPPSPPTSTPTPTPSPPPPSPPTQSSGACNTAACSGCTSCSAAQTCANTYYCSSNQYVTNFQCSTYNGVGSWTAACMTSTPTPSPSPATLINPAAGLVATAIVAMFM